MVIRDPIYNYLYLSSVEQSILDHPLFQRLRFISQNGSAYFTYPSNKSCRFTHSLGTMEIAGKILSTVFYDIDQSVVKSFLLNFYNYISSSIKIIMNTVEQTVKCIVEQDDLKIFVKYGIGYDHIKVGHKNGLREAAYDEKIKEEFARIVIFQSVRIAALLHDLGHFPFSHTTEQALFPSNDIKVINDTYISNLSSANVTSALHERIGIALLDVILPNSDMNAFNKICRYIAQDILKSKKNYNNINEQMIETLHTLVSSDLDSDRLDYCVRDPKLSGLELGAFDIERLINNMQLVLENDKYYILPNSRAVSAVESFFHQRYLMYKYLIYHHNKSRMDGLIGEIIHQLAIIYSSRSPIEIYNYLKSRHFNYLWDCCSEDNYKKCTENWLLSLIADLNDHIKDNHITPSSEIKFLLEMIDTFLERKTCNLYSYFKHFSKYNEFLSDIKTGLNNRNKTLDITCVQAANFIVSLKNPSIYNDISKKYGVKVFYIPIKPKTVFNEANDIEFKIAVDNIHTDNIANYSPYLTSLRQCISEDQLFHIFIFGLNIKTNQPLIDNIKADIVSELIEIIHAKINE